MRREERVYFRDCGCPGAASSRRAAEENMTGEVGRGRILVFLNIHFKYLPCWICPCFTANVVRSGTELLRKLPAIAAITVIRMLQYAP